MTQEAQVTQEVDLYSPLDPSALPDDPAVLKQLLLQLIALLRKETKRREDVERNMDLLLRKLTAGKSVASSPGQLNLFDTTSEAGPTGTHEPPAAAEAPSGPARKSRPHGRRKPPAHLQHIDVVHDLPAEVKEQLGAENLQPLPDVITFQYDYIAATLVVNRHVQKKYLVLESSDPTATSAEPAEAESSISDAVSVSPSVEPAAAQTRPLSPQKVAAGAPRKILLGAKPAYLLDCEAGPGLLAFIWLSKYGDHLPLYRLESITQRYGLTFSRSTTCDWMMMLADRLKPLWEWMCKEVLRSRVIHTDDTTSRLHRPQAGPHPPARFWNYIGDEEYRLVVLDFTTTHERVGPATFLADYEGYLQADAYNGYDGIYFDSQGKIIEVGCWQHARKRFKAAAKQDAIASCGLAFIKSMYAVERKIRQLVRDEWSELSRDERAARIVDIRQRDTRPFVEGLRLWIDKTIGNVLPKSDLADAFRYTLNQWEALTQFLTCGLLAIDNNVAERSHRGIAIGRKNWMYLGSERGGHAAAIHFSLIGSCKMNGIDPFAYLVDVLKRLPTTRESELLNLLPHRWRPASTA